MGFSLQNVTSKAIKEQSSRIGCRKGYAGVSSGRGFTLIELLVVITIIAVIARFSVPAVNSILRGSKLSQSAQTMIEQLSLGRQAALTKNRAVEVRFYRYGDPETPGEDKTNPATGRYRALQFFEISDSGTASAMGGVVRLASSIFIDSGATLSTVIGSAKAAPLVPTLTSSGTQTVSILSVGTKYDAVSFRFNPDGSTTLSPSGLWFMTLHNLNDKDGQAAPPANFFAIQIEPTNGHIKTFRPGLK